MTFDQIIKDIAQKKYAPVYFLQGEEPYFIDQITLRLEKEVLTEEERGFNQTVLYGKDTTAEEIIAQAKQFPMMSSHTVLIVKEAQYLAPHMDKFISYFDQPLNSTLLVFNYKYKVLDKRKKVYKTLGQKAVLFESKKLYTNQIPAFITHYLQEKKISIESEAVFRLLEYVGSDLSRITNELNKFEILQHQHITVEDIGRNIGINKDFNNFDLLRALGDKQILKANKIIQYFSQNPKEHPLVVTLAVLYNFFSNLIVYHTLSDKTPQSVASALKINTYFVKDYQQAATVFSFKKTVQVIAHLRHSDALSKGVEAGNRQAYDILRDLVFNILH